MKSNWEHLGIDYEINWDGIPAGYEYAAIDYDGSIYVYAKKPEIRKSELMFNVPDNYMTCWNAVEIGVTSVCDGWEETLIKRPCNQ